MAVGQKEVAVCIKADQRSAGMRYRPIPSHFEPWVSATIAKVSENGVSSKWQKNSNFEYMSCIMGQHIVGVADNVTGDGPV